VKPVNAAGVVVFLFGFIVVVVVVYGVALLVNDLFEKGIYQHILLLGLGNLFSLPKLLTFGTFYHRFGCCHSLLHHNRPV